MTMPPLMKSLFAVFLLIFFPWVGCAGQNSTPRQRQEAPRSPDPMPYQKEIIFPNGMIIEDASYRRGIGLLDVLRESLTIANLQKDRSGSRADGADRQSDARTGDAYQRNLASARMAHQMILTISDKQGIGDVFVLFRSSHSKITPQSPQYPDLVRFADLVTRKSNGRKIYLVAVGGSPNSGTDGRSRAQVALDVIEPHLLQVQHNSYLFNDPGGLLGNSLPGNDGRNPYAHVTAFFEEDAVYKEASSPAYSAPEGGTYLQKPQDQPMRSGSFNGSPPPHLGGGQFNSLGVAPAPGISQNLGVAQASRDRGRDRRRNPRNVVGMEFVLIQPGVFAMGSPLTELNRDKNEMQHQVQLTRGFYMQTTEVTQWQWEAIMGNRPSFFKNCGEDCPVESVSWLDVQEFLAKLNKLENTKTYRLPTESEWEYACRAGSTTAFENGPTEEGELGYNVSLDRVGWYFRNSDRTPHGVGLKVPNAWGLYDMHGSVWEWCNDWENAYAPHGVTDPPGPSSGVAKIIRGGSWSHYAYFCRSAYRSWFAPDNRRADVGFRVVKDLYEPCADRPPLTAIPCEERKAEPPLDFMIIGDVIFDLDKSTIRKDMVPILENAVTVIKKRGVPIRIEGHTCSLASDEYNQKLSERRANSVKNYFIERGIPANTMETIGYGEKRPRYDNSKEETRRLNRRVEVHFLQGGSK